MQALQWLEQKVQNNESNWSRNLNISDLTTYKNCKRVLKDSAKKGELSKNQSDRILLLCS